MLQYLNTDGFGNRYTGNAEEENYVTIGDTVTFADSTTRSSGRRHVDIDGTIMTPRPGPCVAGLTRSEIEGLLTQKLSPHYTRTDIRVVIGATRKVCLRRREVNGDGRDPSRATSRSWRRSCSPTRATTANLGRVQLIRADPRDPFILQVDVSDMMYTRDTTFNLHVQERDIIYVPPTILKQIADFISSLIVPFTEALNSIFQSIFMYNAYTNGVYYGGNKFGHQGGAF